ncbi:MAG: hypothetical protein ABI193_08885 [Minicystis sp.]
MRFVACLIAPLAAVMLALGCNTVDADQCWPNTSGGLGGEGPIPIGAGVGATSSGDFISPPPHDPLDNGGAPDNPCVTHESPAPNPVPGPSPSTCQVPTQEGEGATAWLCADACFGKCPAPGGGTFVKFYPSDFPFVTVVKDDGEGKAGGWQAAKVNLMFTHAVIPWSVVTWWCPFNIEMPLRTELMGKVSPSLAADLSVEITEGVARDPSTDYSLPQGIFCSQFVAKVDAAFKFKYPKLGALAKK